MGTAFVHFHPQEVPLLTNKLLLSYIYRGPATITIMWESHPPSLHEGIFAPSVGISPPPLPSGVGNRVQLYKPAIVHVLLPL